MPSSCSRYSPSSCVPHSGLSPSSAPTAASTHALSMSGKSSICAARCSLGSLSNSVVKTGAMLRKLICMPTITMPRINVMYSAMPSSRLTDWNVSAKHVATSALASS